MTDGECIDFLKWALPRLSLRWQGFRKVRRQVCRRVKRRIDALGLAGLDDYRDRLLREPSEWIILDGLCRITISRFYRDKRVFDVLGQIVLPGLADAAVSANRAVRCWSAGCASGEEVYSLRMIWDLTVKPRFPGAGFQIVGTDADPVMIERARRGCFSPGSLKDLPADLYQRAFRRSDGTLCIKSDHREDISFALEDVRDHMPAGPFDLVLCRNLAFTYFAGPLQLAVLERIAGRLRETGYLVIGAHEALPPNEFGFDRIGECGEIFRKRSAVGETCDPIVSGASLHNR